MTNVFGTRCRQLHSNQAVQSECSLVDILKEHMFAPTDCTISKCENKSCKTCNILITDNSFSSNFTKLSLTIYSFGKLYCKSVNLVYGIECTLCGLIYVGETKGKLRSRMYGHRFQINHGGYIINLRYTMSRSIGSCRSSIYSKVFVIFVQNYTLCH